MFASVACVQMSPLPQKKSGEETSVNRRCKSCSSIHLHKFFLLLFDLTVEKVLTDQHDWGLLEHVRSYSLECSQH